jgi:hypothetical protein
LGGGNIGVVWQCWQRIWKTADTSHGKSPVVGGVGHESASAAASIESCGLDELLEHAATQAAAAHPAAKTRPLNDKSWICCPRRPR